MGIKLEEALQQRPIEIERLDSAVGDYVGRSRQLIQKRHFAADIARPARSLRLFGDPYCGGAAQKHEDAVRSAAALHERFSGVESLACGFVRDQGPIVSGQV